jgi:hypothetical protein
MKKNILLLVVAVNCALAATTRAEPIADRAAIERVYHSHRTGATETFEQALPADDLRRLVKRDTAREKFLRTHYGVEISAAQIAAETARIHATTRAPETLAEIKAALGGDAARFANAFVKPLLVERELRLRFASDDAFHASLRHVGEITRTNLLHARAAGAAAPELIAHLTRAHSNAVAQITWRLGDGDPAASTPAFASLPPQLREVLAVQLRAPADVSALIETPEKFLLFVVQEKTETKLTAACLVLPKPSCDDWLAIQATTQTNL